jgi:PilZ domain
MMDVSPPPSRDADHAFPDDRRTSLRYPYQQKMLCQPCPLTPSLSPKPVGQALPSDVWDDVWLMGTSQDLSVSEVGFILHRRFEPGTQLTIELERPKLDSWGVLPARVMHSTPQPDGNWKLGCALVKAMTAEGLRGWINGQGTKVAKSQ